MITVVKERLLKNPDYITELLHFFDFYNIKKHKKYISFGRATGHSKKSITLYLEDNDALFIKDYAKNVRSDIFTYIMKTRCVSFKEVISKARSIVGIGDDYFYSSENKEIFGGFYSNIKRNKQIIQNIVSDDYLNNYCNAGNKRFLNDGISLLTQKYFNIGYDIENNGITIPIRNEFGQIIGIKERINDEAENVSNKYFFVKNCAMSQTAYGFYEHYEDIISNDTIFIVEAEKSVLQLHTMGIKNCIAIGSSSISKKQSKLILSTMPKNIILAHDKSLNYDVIKKNAETLLAVGKMREFNMYWINMENDPNVPEKASPSDMGKQKFLELSKDNLQTIK